ncbi:MAG: hypothetical protein DWG77_02535 [Chloroflexi bacterium]|nr:hypothetical protein [Chloroflexota bacterium]
MGASVVILKGRGSRLQPSFYARTGSVTGDLLTLLHAPYTAWHLSYVIFGATMASELGWLRLCGTLAAFFFGTGVAAHALDEWHSRPLGTGLSDRALLTISGVGIAGAGVVTAFGVVWLSPWIVAWAAVGLLLMVGYTLEWHRLLHSDVGFAFAWGGFPVIVGYWAQAEGLAAAPLLLAAAATLLSLAQRALSTPARHVRRELHGARAVFEGDSGDETWDRVRLLATWELPLKLLGAAMVTLAASLLAMRA